MHTTNLKKGFTLFYAVLVSSLLLAIGLAVFSITYRELVLSSGARESSNAFYAADTGIECALYWDLKHASISSPAFGYYGDSLASGLLGYWRFQEGNGVTTVDSSGRGNTGTLVGGPTWVSGKIGGGISFDGTNDAVNIIPVDLTGAFTISLWYNATNDGAFARMISGGGPNDNAGAGRKFGFLNNAGTFTYLVRVINGGSADVSVPAVVGGWHHMVLRRDASNKVDLIIDNGTVRRLFGDVAQSGSFQIYQLGNTPNQFYLGSLDDFRIYNRALSATEVSRLYNLQSNLQFTAPIAQNTSGVMCLGANITAPASGWDPASGWNVTTTATAATTTFDMLLPNNRCATVQVVKNSTTTAITSRGYNNCNLTDPRRVERAIKATY